MAEIDIGKHCSMQECRQLDFLPFTCSACQQIFCKIHKSWDAHQCPKGESRTGTVVFDGEKAYDCSLPSCSNRELTKTFCEACKKTFCLSHRHQLDHDCENYEAPKERMTQTKQHVQQILESKKGPARQKGQGKKSKAMAAKVMLMKIKMKAVGDKGTPDTEKVFFQVILPLGSKEKSRPMFFSKKWSMGRIIDQMASLNGLQNNNNVAAAKKLRLFDADDGRLYATDQVLEALMGDDAIVNGGSLILEYVAEDETCIKTENYKLR